MRTHHLAVTLPQDAPAAAPSSAHTSTHSRIRPPVCCPTCGTVLLRVAASPPNNTDDPVAIAPYDVEAFADLICTDPARAAAQLGALSASAQTRQALAYVTWLEHYGIPISVDAVLAAWSVLLSAHALKATGEASPRT